MTSAMLDVVNLHRKMYELWTSVYLPEIQRGSTQKSCYEALAKRLGMKPGNVKNQIRSWELKGEARCLGKNLNVTPVMKSEKW